MGMFAKDSDSRVNAKGTAPLPERLLEQLSNRIRFKHHSIQTKQV